jgi:hypothetical protein
MEVSVGIGITNDCNLECAHCYRPQGQIYQLDLDEIRAICETLDVASFNMGTGESWLHPQFAEIVEYLAERGITTSMASNGYSLTEMPTSLLRRFHDVELSVDFATPERQDAFRGTGNWACVMQAIERCHAQGIEVTILTTLMYTNHSEMDGLVRGQPAGQRLPAGGTERLSAELRAVLGGLQAAPRRRAASQQQRTHRQRHAGSGEPDRLPLRTAEHPLHAAAVHHPLRILAPARPIPG